MTVRSVARAAPCHVKNARRLPSSPPTSCPNCHTLTLTRTPTHTRSCQPPVTMHLLSDRILISGLAGVTWLVERERKSRIWMVGKRVFFFRGGLENVDKGDWRKGLGRGKVEERDWAKQTSRVADDVGKRQDRRVESESTGGGEFSNFLSFGRVFLRGTHQNSTHKWLTQSRPLLNAHIPNCHIDESARVLTPTEPLTRLRSSLWHAVRRKTRREEDEAKMGLRSEETQK